MKASELCVLCGAEVAIVVFSPTGKPFSYGHPSTDDVFRRFLTDGGPSEPSPATALCASLNAKLLYLTNRLEYEKKRRSLLEAAVRAPWLAQKPFWWDANIHSMALEELGEFERVLLQYHDAIGQEADPRVGPCGPVSQLGCVNRWPLATPVPQFDAIDCFPPLQQPHSIVPLQAYGLGGFDYGL